MCHEIYCELNWSVVFFFYFDFGTANVCLTIRHSSEYSYPADMTVLSKDITAAINRREPCVVMLLGADLS